jgi:hypothetical protein
MVTLAEAREERDAARKLIAKGKDPVQVRQAQKRQAQLENENNFAFIANEWFEYASPRWAETTQYKAKLYLQNDLLPHLGHRPVTEITRPELVDEWHRSGSCPDRVGVSAAFYLVKDNGAVGLQSELPFNRLYSFLERLRGAFRIQARVET